MDKICGYCGYIIVKGADTKTMWVSDKNKNIKHIKVTLHRSCWNKVEEGLSIK